MAIAKCRVCHRPLTSPDAIAAGVGPICAQKQPRTGASGMARSDELAEHVQRSARRQRLSALYEHACDLLHRLGVRRSQAIRAVEGAAWDRDAEALAEAQARYDTLNGAYDRCYRLLLRCETIWWAAVRAAA